MGVLALLIALMVANRIEDREGAGRERGTILKLC
jgi:hypothetical protein